MSDHSGTDKAAKVADHYSMQGCIIPTLDWQQLQIDVQ